MTDHRPTLLMRLRAGTGAFFRACVPGLAKIFGVDEQLEQTVSSLKRAKEIGTHLGTLAFWIVLAMFGGFSLAKCQTSSRLEILETRVSEKNDALESYRFDLQKHGQQVEALKSENSEIRRQRDDAVYALAPFKDLAERQYTNSSVAVAMKKLIEDFEAFRPKHPILEITLNGVVVSTNLQLSLRAVDVVSLSVKNVGEIAAENLTLICYVECDPKLVSSSGWKTNGYLIPKPPTNSSMDRWPAYSTADPGLVFVSQIFVAPSLDFASDLKTSGVGIRMRLEASAKGISVVSRTVIIQYLK